MEFDNCYGEWGVKDCPKGRVARRSSVSDELVNINLDDQRPVKS